MSRKIIQGQPLDGKAFDKALESARDKYMNGDQDSFDCALALTQELILKAIDEGQSEVDHCFSTKQKPRVVDALVEWFDVHGIKLERYEKNGSPCFKASGF